MKKNYFGPVPISLVLVQTGGPSASSLLLNYVQRSEQSCLNWIKKCPFSREINLLGNAFYAWYQFTKNFQHRGCHRHCHPIVYIADQEVENEEKEKFGKYWFMDRSRGGIG